MGKKFENVLKISMLEILKIYNIERSNLHQHWNKCFSNNKI